MKTYVFGHKRPDTDSVCSAIAYAYLKKQLGIDAEARVLGDINLETKYVLNRFNIPEPKYLNDVKIQIKNMKYLKGAYINENVSLNNAFDKMHELNVTGLPMVDEDNKLKGYVNLKDCEIFTDKNYCSVLFNSLNIEEIIISSRIASNLTEIDPDIYIKVTNRLISTTNYFLVAKFSDNSYAALDTVLDFREDIEVKFTGFFSTSNYDTTLKQGGTLRIKLSEQPNSLLIQGLNTPNEYIAGTDYTYNRETGILIFKRIPESIEIIAQGIEYCKFYKEKAEKTDLDLSECLVVSNYANYNAYSDELRYKTAKEIISVVPEDSKNKPEPYIIYTEYESEKLTAAGNKSVTGSYYDDTIIPVSTTGYNFDITRGVYELKKEDETYKYMSLSEMKEYLNNNNNNKLYSCLSAEVVKCRNLWEIKKIDINDKSKYYISKAIKHTYLVNEDYSNNPGLYKVEDDYTSNNSNYSYIYRGQLENNWVKLGDFLYRIIRINGNGTIRLIYSGKANDESHTEGNAVIKDSSFAPKPNNSDKILGYTASTYVGYKYNPTLKVGQYESTNDSSTLDKYLMNDGISSNSKFYIFKNFNKNTCVVNNGYCELKCDYSCDESDNSCNCINVIWPNYWQDEDLYNTTSSVNAVDKYYTRYQYTGDYKYSCFQFSKVSEENGEVTVTCPVVEEIVGVVSNYPRYAVVKNYGLLSSTNEEDDHYFAKNESNSNVKTVVDEWYKENFTTIDSQTNEEVGTELSNYLSDEIFCNDRTNNKDD